MKIYFLGTNGWYDTPTGNTACALIDSMEGYIILDAGNGIYKIDRFIKTAKPIYLFISHFHLDHIFGLHILAKFKFKQALNIYGQSGTRRILSQLINKPFTAPMAKLSIKVKIHDLSEGVHHIPFYLKCNALVHPVKCFGYRIKLENKIITYCTDTGICDAAIELAKDADLLISECSYKNSIQRNSWPHLDPLSAANIAKVAKVKKLVLTHFDAQIYSALKERKKAEFQARKIFSQSRVAYDGQLINL